LAKTCQVHLIFDFQLNIDKKISKRNGLKKFFSYIRQYLSSQNKASNLKTIGTILRELREAKGLLLREVGAKLSLDPTILSKIERDERMPTSEQATALSNFYKEQKNDVIIAWLSDKLAYEVQDEDLALEAMKMAEEKVKYAKTKRK